LIVRYLSFTIDITIQQVLEEVKPSMNEKHIQQVLEIEKQAQEIHEVALREAQQLPIQAEQEAQALIAKAKAEAHEEARAMLAQAQPGDGSGAADLPAAGGPEASAKQNFDKAVAFVLERVIGRA
jgi:cell division septum initiation protein DivIVA